MHRLANKFLFIFYLPCALANIKRYVCDLLRSERSSQNVL